MAPRWSFSIHAPRWSFFIHCDSRHSVQLEASQGATARRFAPGNVKPRWSPGFLSCRNAASTVGGQPHLSDFDLPIEVPRLFPAEADPVSWRVGIGIGALAHEIRVSR